MDRARARSPRRAVILVTVLLMLTLFTVVALSFALYADAAATGARAARQAEQPMRPDVEPELLLAAFLNRLLYDAPDDEAGIFCAMRGHSLARSLYGTAGGDTVPFNGIGRPDVPSPFAGVSDARLINYTAYPNDPQIAPGQRFLRDPERLGWRPADPRAPRGPFNGGLNAHYTYPDLNSTFLAAVRPDGAVLLPSFHRPWAADVPGSGLPPGAGEFYDRVTGKLNPLWSPSPPSLPPWYKSTTLRPLPALNPGFPPPEDGGGDVKNLTGGPGTLRRIRDGVPEFWDNDSFWIDLDFPVLTAPSGKKYKPLFAPLIVDLDGRVNVNVHGNAHGPDGRHASNQGWGPWEVNPAHVLTGQTGQESRNLLLGTARPALTGRYGGRPWNNEPGTPGAPGKAAPAGPTPHHYAPVDFAGTGAYANRSLADRFQHAQLFNPFRPTADDRRFAASNMEALLRYGETGSPMATSELFRLCPESFQRPRARHLVTTHSMDLDRPGVTPWLHDLARSPFDVPGTVDPDHPGRPEGPRVPFPDLATERRFRLDNGEFRGVDGRALTAALGRVNLSRPLPPYPHQGSGPSPPFGPPLTVVGGQVALDVPFTVDYPTGPIWKQFVVAQEVRQRLANDLYRRLLAVTGVVPVLPDQGPQAPPAGLLRARRWLAQLAVNIVDFIDEDDISTPFCFYTAEDYGHLLQPPAVPPDPARTDASRPIDRPDGEIQWPLYWVFGTERPRLVINEVMAHARQSDPTAAYEDQVRVFAELHHVNPRTIAPTAYAPDAFPAPLRMTSGAVSYSPYRVVVGTASPLPFPLTGAGILPGADDDNVLGNPDLAVLRTATSDADFLRGAGTVGGEPQAAWPGTATYRGLSSPHVPAHGPEDGVTPPGYFLLGPPEVPPQPNAPPSPFLVHDPFRALAGTPVAPATPLLRLPALQYVHYFPARGSTDPPDERTHGVTVTLRRLANPYLPFDGRRAGPTGSGPNFTYNPFVTVDFVEGIPLQAVESGVTLPLTSVGRGQPFAAHRSQFVPQAVGPTADQRATFGRDNVPAVPADHLIHLDRPPISPMELLHVAGCKPYQLTQQFLTTDGDGQPVRQGHRAPWVEEEQVPGTPHRRIYRLFEFLTAGALPTGVAPGGRLPGKVNVNTIWGPETLLALCDPQSANGFTEADVRALFSARFYDDRPDASSDALRRTAGPIPWEGDRPFRSLAVGTYPPGDRQFPSGGGVGDTVLRLLPPPSGGHPYAESALLTKIAYHLTTRSNVFAVWVTVGFFEVTDVTSRPVKLGPEIGKSEGKNLRHRFFAILDRTNLSLASFVTTLREPVVVLPGFPAVQTVTVGSLAGTTTLPLTGPALTWAIRPGTMLIVDVGDAQETVRVLTVDAARQTFTAAFTRPHAAGAALSLADAPGAPPVFLPVLSLTRPEPLPTPPYVPQPPYPVDLTLSVDPNRSGPAVLGGVHDGVSWALRPGTPLLLDAGPNQEVLTVAATPFRIDAAGGTGTFRVIVMKPHADGLVVSNTLLGNPGPRERFDPRDPRFAAVVRYFSVID